MFLRKQTSTIARIAIVLMLSLSINIQAQNKMKEPSLFQKIQASLGEIIQIPELYVAAAVGIFVIKLPRIAKNLKIGSVPKDMAHNRPEAQQFGDSLATSYSPPPSPDFKDTPICRCSLSLQEEWDRLPLGRSRYIANAPHVFVTTNEIPFQNYQANAVHQLENSSGNTAISVSALGGFDFVDRGTQNLIFLDLSSEVVFFMKKVREIIEESQSVAEFASRVIQTLRDNREVFFAQSTAAYLINENPQMGSVEIRGRVANFLEAIKKKPVSDSQRREFEQLQYERLEYSVIPRFLESLQREGSVLGYQETYNWVRRIVLNGRMFIGQADVGNQDTMTSIQRFMQQNDMRVRSFYVSNVAVSNGAVEDAFKLVSSSQSIANNVARLLSSSNLAFVIFSARNLRDDFEQQVFLHDQKARTPERLKSLLSNHFFQL